MKAWLAGTCALAALLVPASALAADSSAVQTRLTPLYMQLIEILKEELAYLQHPTQPVLSVFPVYGNPTLTVMYTVHNATGKELVDFGDGHYAKSDCTGAGTWCSKDGPVYHSYNTPAQYSAALWARINGTPQELNGANIIVAPRP